MSDKISPFIYTTNKYTGEKYAIPNPEWQKKHDEKLFSYRLNKSEIPTIYHNLFLDNIQVPQIMIDKAKEIVYNKHNLYLWSKEGKNGKTSLATALMIDIMRSTGKYGHFMTAKSLIDLLMRTSGFSKRKDDPESFGLKDTIMSRDIIIIEDALDKTKSTFYSSNPDLIISEWHEFIKNMIYKEKLIILVGRVKPENIAVEFSKDMYDLLESNFSFLEFKNDKKFKKD